MCGFWKADHGVVCVIARKSIRRVGSPAEREDETQKQQRQQQEEEAAAGEGEVAQARRMQQGRSMVPGGIDPLGTIGPSGEALGPAVRDLPAYKPYIAMVAAGIKDRETVMTEMRMKVGASSIRHKTATKTMRMKVGAR
jgi:hypothetical protein